jgi:hypothetical protein
MRSFDLNHNGLNSISYINGSAAISYCKKVLETVIINNSKSQFSIVRFISDVLQFILNSHQPKLICHGFEPDIKGIKL